ncbi:MAG: NADPH:quinone oxidoreductase family protein [Pseudomonadota bacterium]
MRALVCNEYGPPDTLAIEERPAPEAGPGQLAIEVRAAGINFPDLLMIAGKYQVKTPPPFIPGAEAAGIVTAVGDGVSRYKPGDRVIAMPLGGAFADVCIAEEHSTVPMPDGLDFVTAAGFAITYFTTAHALVQSAGLEAGEILLVLGAAGGVGSAAIDLGKAMGARVIAAASSDAKLEFARELGADETINYSTDKLNDAVKSLTDGNGADVVYDPVGGELAQAALRATAWHGRYLVIGFASGDIPALPANLALLKEASIVGVWWGTWAARHPELQLDNMRFLAGLLADGKIRPRVTESYPLDEFRAAFAALGERRAQGKVILDFD